MSSTRRQSKLTLNAIQQWLQPLNLGVYGRFWLSRCCKENELIGVFTLSPRSSSLYRKADRAGQNFAAQAVIAIENTRLLNELRQRTTDLTDAQPTSPKR